MWLTEYLAKLKPILASTEVEATVTAGDASGQNDAAAMCLVTTPERAEQLGLRPLVRLVFWAVAGVEPELMGIGPVVVTDAALSRSGLTLQDMGVIELNEAFAAQALAVMREWNFTAADHERTNSHGSGISLGHPVGATGGRMLGTLARELHRRQARYGLETTCIASAVAKTSPRSSNAPPERAGRARQRGERAACSEHGPTHADAAARAS